MQECIRITDISADQPADSSENPIVKCLAENDIKHSTAILSECKRQAKEDKEQDDNDQEGKLEGDKEKENNSHVSNAIAASMR